MYQDRLGLPLTTTPAAAGAYRRADRIFFWWVDAGAVLEQAIAEDSGFALAYRARPSSSNLWRSCRRSRKSGSTQPGRPN